MQNQAAWIPLLSLLTKIVLALLIGLSIWSVRIMLGRLKKLASLDQQSLHSEIDALISPQSTPESIDRSFESWMTLKRMDLERGLTVLATLGSNAPFIGLFGTVLGIIQAFGELSQNQNGTQSVMAAISEALVATAVGLLVAIPAVVAFNTFNKKVRDLLGEASAYKDQKVSAWIQNRSSATPSGARS
jgi:biopolymer transport protein ExbB/TolQ